MHNVQSPRTDDSAIEQEIQAKGLTAPRVTPADIEANIVGEYYVNAGEAVRAGMERYLEETDPLYLLTFCILVLRSGFTVTGDAYARPENFDEEVGKKIARANAVNKIWPLMNYALKEKLSSI